MRTSQSDISTPLSLMLTPTNNLLPAVSERSVFGGEAWSSVLAGELEISFTGATGTCGSRADTGLCGDKGRVEVPIVEFGGIPPVRGGVGPSTVLTEGCTSTEPSRRPIPSMFSPCRRAVNDAVIIRLGPALRNRAQRESRAERMHPLQWRRHSGGEVLSV